MKKAGSKEQQIVSEVYSSVIVPMLVVSGAVT